ncbi:serpin family protein [Lentzea sp. BCCO 10_0798]|uniref:Serpin family protein n=1 Tax=Lentzea kristufekii TaxID=3095430 RepID=A0ABU4TPU8_9PSEU|nr:serpin family protein [Lentzea sp. BCCO 10_0798]MDX8050069.1 serpin family protein [Lentzea sp. BCCO 10_0798]
MSDLTTFALDLHRVAVPDPDANACWSPFSVASALALVREAARGATREELDLLLDGFDPGAVPGVRDLAVANTLWADDCLPLNPDFSLTSSVRRADFSDAKTTRKLVNADVAETTRGLIPELLPAGLKFDGAVIVNALYLKASWTTAFKAHRTKPRLFHAPGGDVEVPTMKTTARLGYARTDGWQTIALPAGPGVEALVLLPDESLEQPLLPSAFDVGGTTSVELSLPKVDVREKFELRDTLKRLGAGTMFTPRADLGGLSPDPLSVSEVIHEAVLRLDEQGLEGAAATAVVMTRGRSGPGPDPIVVDVDRPFLVAVRHARAKAIYFLAQVATP